MTKLNIRTGSEGPRHDPYGYDEIIVGRFGHEFRLHTGLACWLRVDGETIDVPEVLLFEEFKRLTGFHPADWHKFYNRLEQRRAADDPYHGYDPYFGGM